MVKDDTDNSLKEKNKDDAPKEKKRVTITPHENDVVSGRGSGANRHVGNAKFRELVKDKKALYISLTKHEKMSVARTILATISSREPPGRFLQKNPETFQWFEIGQSRALEKISQALREKTHQHVKDKIPLCQTSQPQDFWSNGIYRPSREKGTMLPLHLRNNGQHPVSNSIENQLKDPSSSAKEMSRFNGAVTSMQNLRTSMQNLTQEYHDHMTTTRRQTNSNQHYLDTNRNQYRHKTPRIDSEAFEPMMPMNIPSRYERGQSFSAMYPSQVSSDQISSKYMTFAESDSMHTSHDGRHVWPPPHLRGRHDPQRCHPFSPLPEPPLPPESSDNMFKNPFQTLRGRESWNRNSTFLDRSATLTPKSGYLSNRTYPSRKMRFPIAPPLTCDYMNTQKHKRPPSLLVSDVQSNTTSRGLQTNKIMNPRKRHGSFAPSNESKRLCVNVEDTSNHNVVSSESNDEETIGTQPLGNYSTSSSNTNSPSSSTGTNEGENPKVEDVFQSSGLLALSTAALMHAQVKRLTQ